MFDHYYQYMQELQSCRAVTDLQQACQRFCQQQGFDNFIYGARISESLQSPSYIIVNGYPAEWRQHYEDSDYLHIDPTVKHCFTQTLPIFWQDIDKRPANAQKVFSEAADFGLNSGVSIPVHCVRGGTAMLSLSSEQPTYQSQKHFLNKLALSHLFANYLHEAVLRISEKNSELHLNPNLLSDREKECLLWVSEGKTNSDVSHILRISERTVNFHINNTIRKLSVNNRQQAVARAITLGHIEPRI